LQIPQKSGNRLDVVGRIETRPNQKQEVSKLLIRIFEKPASDFLIDNVFQYVCGPYNKPEPINRIITGRGLQKINEKDNLSTSAKRALKHLTRLLKIT